MMLKLFHLLVVAIALANNVVVDAVGLEKAAEAAEDQEAAEAEEAEASSRPRRRDPQPPRDPQPAGWIQTNKKFNADKKSSNNNAGKAVAAKGHNQNKSSTSTTTSSSSSSKKKGWNSLTKTQKGLIIGGAVVGTAAIAGGVYYATKGNKKKKNKNKNKNQQQVRGSANEADDSDDYDADRPMYKSVARAMKLTDWEILPDEIIVESKEWGGFPKGGKIGIVTTSHIDDKKNIIADGVILDDVTEKGWAAGMTDLGEFIGWKISKINGRRILTQADWGPVVSCIKPGDKVLFSLNPPDDGPALQNPFILGFDDLPNAKEEDIPAMSIMGRRGMTQDGAAGVVDCLVLKHTRWAFINKTLNKLLAAQILL
eukprot:gene991-343_t